MVKVKAYKGFLDHPVLQIKYWTGWCTEHLSASSYTSDKLSKMVGFFMA